jgi:predicted phage terminase large subunit-like protein
MFQLCDQFSLNVLGIEQVAYQEALLYMLDDEMRRRQKILPVKGITRSKTSKQTRILALVPRFEWSRIYLMPGMTDLEDELENFPRGAHDDIVDSLASLEELVYYPEKEKHVLEQPHSANDPNYEKWYIQQLARRANEGKSYGSGGAEGIDY